MSSRTQIGDLWLEKGYDSAVGLSVVVGNYKLTEDFHLAIRYVEARDEIRSGIIHIDSHDELIYDCSVPR